MSDKNKFPHEVVDLPSDGKLYPKDSPIHNGRIALRYMTAQHEDILTSQNLIKKGVVMDELLKSLILTEGISPDDLILGDKNAIMVAARILAYGPEYTVEVVNPNTLDKFQHTFNLTDCPFRELPKDVDYSSNEFEIELPISKTKLTFKLLTGKDEKDIIVELNSLKKIGKPSTEITTRLKKAILSVNGETAPGKINLFVDNMLSRDSLFLREEMARIAPDIILEQEVELEGETVTLDIPMSVDFFWPKTRT